MNRIIIAYIQKSHACTLKNIGWWKKLTKIRQQTMDHDRKPEDRFECELNGNELEKYGPYSWMVRPCEWYLQEYKDCKCKSNFIYFFIFFL